MAKAPVIPAVENRILPISDEDTQKVIEAIKKVRNGGNGKPTVEEKHLTIPAPNLKIAGLRGGASSPA